MLRDVDIKEISDGRTYGPNDMVKADTGSCKGCSRCCHGMCDTILLEPLDVFRLEKALGCSFSELLQGRLVLRMADGLILPRLASVGDLSGDSADGQGDRCVFLNEQGRCSIHAARPALCRLYPLGRYYPPEQGDDFVYILQTQECDHPRTKVKVKRWLDLPDLARYEDSVRKWHGLIRSAAALADADESLRKPICMAILQTFYETQWDLEEDFYPQFEKRLALARGKIGLA